MLPQKILLDIHQNQNINHKHDCENFPIISPIAVDGNPCCLLSLQEHRNDSPTSQSTIPG
jgi:hypothetical protein